jgi:hypothetical protein
MTVFGVVNFALAECAAGGQACALSGLEQSNGAAGNLPGPTSANDNGAWLTGQVGNIIGNILAFVGLIFMGLILYAGYLWMTAGGDSAKTTKAISIMTDAVVGLIVIAAAYLLTQYVGNVVLGSLTTAGTQ